MGDLNAGLLAGVAGVPGAQSGQLQGRAAAPAQAVLQARPSRYAVDHGVSIEQLAQFDEKQVAQWISTAFPRLGQFAPLFIEHQIEGPLFLRLTDDMLREMGINCASVPSARPRHKLDPRLGQAAAAPSTL